VGCEADLLHFSSAGNVNAWNCTFTLPHIIKDAPTSGFCFM